MHLSLYTLLCSAINLRDCQSIKEVQKKLKKGIGKELIVGWGFDHEQFQEKRMPTREDLDAISSEIPIFILRFDEHIGVVNSEVLRRLGINQDTIDPLILLLVNISFYLLIYLKEIISYLLKVKQKEIKL
jgi:predicted amidohydrolase YtcJ